MPVYTYVCEMCGQQDDAKVSIADRDKVQKCSRCGGESKRRFVPQDMPPVYYWGMGWAKKDRINGND